MSYIFLYQELNKDPTLRQNVRSMIREISPTIEAFVREKRVSYHALDQGDLMARWIYLEHPKDVERSVQVHPARDDGGQLGIVARPSVIRAINGYGHTLPSQLESYFALPNPESVQDALEKAYQNVMAVKPEDITVLIQPRIERLAV